MRPPKRSGSRHRFRSRHDRGAKGPGLELAIVVHGGVVQNVYANRCGPLTVYLLDYDDLRADDDLAEAVARTAELPQVTVEAGLARAVAEYRGVATRQATLRLAADARSATGAQKSVPAKRHTSFTEGSGYCSGAHVEL